MYQTFYIDVDEEVNSVITRIRKSSAKYNILVISPGSLIMQSAISLKLIKKEIDLLEKKIMVITKDERNAAIAKKIGFLVKSSLDEIKGLTNGEEIRKNDISLKKEEKKYYENESNDLERVPTKKTRLNNLGADNFVAMGGIIKKNNSEKPIVVYENNSRKNVVDKKESEVSVNIQKNSQDDFDNFFENSSQTDPEEKKNISTKSVLSFLWIFIAMIGTLIFGIWAYFYIPKAEIIVYPQIKESKLNLKLKALTSFDEGENNFSQDEIVVRLKIIEDEAILALTFEATGQKNSANQKSKGTIEILNNFSETSQVLVATTRLLSNDDKLFRLLNTVTVPGMTLENGENKSGKIEAEIIADEAGENFNFKEATFTIPGFRGSSKYDKFSAKLIKETRGGGDKGGELKTISSSDVESAKFKAEKQLKDELKDKIKNKLGSDNILLENALSYEILDYSVFPEEGSVGDSFEYQVKIKIKALSFSGNEIDEKIKNILNNQKNAQKDMELIHFSKEYGRADIDFNNKTIKTELNINAKSKAIIDSTEVIDFLAGKKQGEINSIISVYPKINKIEATIFPDFLSGNFPKYKSRIEVKIFNE